MKISVINNSIEKKFSEINIGDCFEYDDHFYMRTNKVCYGDDDLDYINCINIKDGLADRFCDDCEVIPIDASVSVSRRIT